MYSNLEDGLKLAELSNFLISSTVVANTSPMVCSIALLFRGLFMKCI
jgi:hypothetical protein